jgi:hypothetical protein
MLKLLTGVHNCRSLSRLFNLLLCPWFGLLLARDAWCRLVLAKDFLILTWSTMVQSVALAGRVMTKPLLHPPHVVDGFVLARQNFFALVPLLVRI